jgi:hypothetical protein
MLRLRRAEAMLYPARSRIERDWFYEMGRVW